MVRLVPQNVYFDPFCANKNDHVTGVYRSLGPDSSLLALTPTISFRQMQLHLFHTINLSSDLRRISGTLCICDGDYLRLLFTASEEIQFSTHLISVMESNVHSKQVGAEYADMYPLQSTAMTPQRRIVRQHGNNVSKIRGMSMQSLAPLSSRR